MDLDFVTKKYLELNFAMKNTWIWILQFKIPKFRFLGLIFKN